MLVSFERLEYILMHSVRVPSNQLFLGIFPLR